MSNAVERNLKAHLSQQVAIQLQQTAHPVYNPAPVFNPGMPPIGNGIPMMGNATPFPVMAGNATPFPNVAGNVTPFPNMAGNATPFPNAVGNATPWNSYNNYAPTPFNSFSLDNQVSTAFDPRFPPPPPMMGGNTPPPNNMVDTAFSKRANANFKHNERTKARASRGRGSRPGPVFADRGRGSRSNGKPDKTT